jgi:hypothetical protein
MAFALILCLVAPIVKPLRLADLVLFAGLVGWAPFLIACRKLMATGLETPRGWRPRILWGGIGALVGFAVELHLHQDLPWRQPIHFYSLPTTGLLVATMIGEKLHQIHTGTAANGPYISTLFGKERPR